MCCHIGFGYRVFHVPDSTALLQFCKKKVCKRLTFAIWFFFLQLVSLLSRYWKNGLKDKSLNSCCRPVYLVAGIVHFVLFELIPYYCAFVYVLISYYIWIVLQWKAVDISNVIFSSYWQTCCQNLLPNIK